ncbi:hypothetical protein GYMLUDRAFT_207969 [Collybiopsis luxurians FD-317 M1]|uniref:Uncharacterized protein n=1 Tax=Collybiopsis luxurians FD-317 M1 TaxID=944289 RepID=A0A0D0CC75_9AGAR|nr:hypothetical protein GYMLUDRAFT_207969 [Collybiopsis luxurians FD-317 M1]
MSPALLLPPTSVRAAVTPQKTIIVDQNLATLAQLTEPDVTGLVCQAIFYGIYVSIAWPTLSALLNKRPRTKPWFFLLTSTILMLLMSTVCLVLEAVSTMAVLEGIKLETEGAFQPPTAWYGFRGANNRTLAQAIIFSLEFILGDAIVIWRAGALWKFDLPIMIIMLTPLLADFATTLYFIGCEGQADWWYIAGTEPKSCNVAQRGMFLLSFSTNVVAVFFIAVKAWFHRQAFITMPDSLSSSSSWKKLRSPAQKIMILFLESGFIYMLFWAACSFTYFPFVLGVESAAYFMTTLFNSIRYQIVGLYPTVIVLLVHRESLQWGSPAISNAVHSSFKAAPGPGGSLPKRHKPSTTFNFSTVGTVTDIVDHEADESQSTESTSLRKASNGLPQSLDEKTQSNQPVVSFVRPVVSHERSPSDGPSVISDETAVAI